MKKLIKTIFIAALMVLFMPHKTFAAGGFNLSASSITMHPGESTTLMITADNSAGKINIASSDPSVVSINPSVIFLDLNSEPITLSANALGSVTISVEASSNFATYDEEVLAGVTKTVTVNVVELPPAPTPSTPTAPVNASTNTNPEASLESKTDSAVDTETVMPISTDGTQESVSLENSSSYEASPSTNSIAIDPLPVVSIIAIVEGCALAIIAVLHFSHRS
ncbi:hypothetical protein IJI00_02280 [Candidatus Saccharibacteria bacterium]|nr:hypothetical protein [Candidatus Saccharibacteria bacterium]